jgi:xylulokinase
LMTRELLMGIDIGTQSTRVALLDPQGKVISSSSTPQDMVTPKPGWAEQDPDLWWHNVIDNIPKALDAASVKPSDILAIGVCGQMHATVPIDQDGSLLSHGVQLWCDKRCADLVDAFKRGPNLEQAMQISGNPPVPAWLGFNISWLKTHQPELYDHSWKFLTSQGYINYRLTGQLSIDWTEASGSFLMDARTKSWSPDLVSYMGLDLDKLAPLKPSSEVLGTLTPDAALLTGLKAGTPVVVGAGDMLCMLISAGLTQPGRAADITGTASIMAVYVGEPVMDPRLMNLHHAIPGWIPFGISDSGGGALKWFKDSFCETQSELATQCDKDVYDILNPMAAKVKPGSEGLLFFPYLMGERSMGSAFSRGVFFGLTPRNTRGALVRAIMEGVTFELRRTLEIVQDSGNQVDQIYTIGGGARSDLWSQIKADIYQRPVLTFEACEGGILGAAMLAGVGTGVYLDVRTAAGQCLRMDKTFKPDPGRAARYDYLYSLFLDLHDRFQEPFERLSLMP